MMRDLAVVTHQRWMHDVAVMRPKLPTSIHRPARFFAVGKATRWS